MFGNASNIAGFVFQMLQLIAIHPDARVLRLGKLDRKCGCFTEGIWSGYGIIEEVVFL